MLLCNYGRENGIDLNKILISIFEGVNVQASDTSCSFGAVKYVGNVASQI